MRKHEKNPEKVYRTQTIRRGYTKKTEKYWHEKNLSIHPEDGDASIPDMPTGNLSLPNVEEQQTMNGLASMSPHGIPAHTRVITSHNFSHYPLTFHNL